MKFIEDLRVFVLTLNVCCVFYVACDGYYHIPFTRKWLHINRWHAVIKRACLCTGSLKSMITAKYFQNVEDFEQLEVFKFKALSFTFPELKCWM